MNVIRPSGILPSLNVDAFVYCDLKQHYIHHTIFKYGEYLTYSFLLDEHLRLNISFAFVYISFSNGNTAECMDGYVSVQSNNQNLKYCGILPALSSFPLSNSLHIKLRCKPHVFMRTQISYTIMDSNQIVSYSTLPNSRTKILFQKYVIYFWAGSFSLSRFHIKVDTYKHICFNVSSTDNEDIEIHNGPGTKSKKIRPTQRMHGRNIFKTIKFQSVVFLRIKHASLNSVLRYFGTASAKSLVYLHNKSSPEKLFLNESVCKPFTVCVKSLETDANFFLNISFTFADYKGHKSTGHCDYSGVSTYSMREIPEPISTECTKHMHLKKYSEKDNFLTDSGGRLSQLFLYNISSFSEEFTTISKYKHIYSESNKLLLVWYAYPEYGMMNVDLRMSVAVCKSIILKIETCDFDIQTYDGPFLPQNTGLRIRYFKKSLSNKFTKFTMEHDEHVDVTLELQHMLHLECFVLVLMVNAPKSSRCVLDICSSQTTKLSKRITLTGTGTWRGQFQSFWFLGAWPTCLLPTCDVMCTREWFI